MCFRPADQATTIVAAAYNGPVYMRSGRRIPTERSKFTELLGGGRPDESNISSDACDANVISAWICFNTEIQTFRYEPGSTYDDLHQHVVSEMGLSPRADLHVNVWSASEATDGQAYHEIVQTLGNATELPSNATYYDVEHTASKKQKNSDKL
jgi:hypothetical protein